MKALVKGLGRFLGTRFGLLSLGLIALLALYLIGDGGGGRGEPCGGSYRVERVIDGDTIEVKGLDARVRYLGIDTPEVLTPYSPGEALGEEAKEFNESRVLGEMVRLQCDEEEYDRYGRLLAFVFVDGVSVNEALVREGLARALFIGPNYLYMGRIQEAENYAKKRRKGIWSGLEALRPPRSSGGFLIAPREAKGFIGRGAVVRGRITGVRRSRKVIALHMGDAFDVVIFTHDLGNFSFFGIDPARFYDGKIVEAVGRVSVYKGKPQIIVPHPLALRVVQ